MAVKPNISFKVFALGGFDFTHAFDKMNIYEDLQKNSFSGTIDIKETEGIREIVPIIGEEYGLAMFSSVAPNSGVEHETIQFPFKVNKIEQLREGASAQRYYRFHFVSVSHELNLHKRVRKHFRGPACQIVNRITKAMFGVDLKTVDPCKHEQSFVFPNWHPNQCINWLSTAAVSSKYNDPYYMFYEDRYGFHFNSLSALMDKPAEETIEMEFANRDKDDDTWDGLQMSSFTTAPLWDTIENMHIGMYGNTVVAYDKINKTLTETGATYSGTYDDFIHVGKEKLTKRRWESPKNRFQFIMQNAPAHEGVYTHLDDWANRRIIRAGQVRNNRIHIAVNGKTSIRLGDTINWNLRSTIDDVELDAVLSGKYLITKIRHIVTLQTYSQLLEIVKDGIG